jgi:hypothetical protein
MRLATEYLSEQTLVGGARFGFRGSHSWPILLSAQNMPTHSKDVLEKGSVEVSCKILRRFYCRHELKCFFLALAFLSCLGT